MSWDTGRLLLSCESVLLLNSDEMSETGRYLLGLDGDTGLRLCRTSTL